MSLWSNWVCWFILTYSYSLKMLTMEFFQWTIVIWDLDVFIVVGLYRLLNTIIMPVIWDIVMPMWHHCSEQTQCSMAIKTRYGASILNCVYFFSNVAVLCELICYIALLWKFYYTILSILLYIYQNGTDNCWSKNLNEFKPFCPTDPMRWHRSSSALDPVMYFCLMAPSYYLGQYWFITKIL